MKRQSNRRDFLKQSTAATAGFWVATRAAKASNSPNEKFNAACIGCGGMGEGDTSDTANHGANIVALCDVDDAKASPSYNKFPGAKRFHDFREMFDKMHKEIDIVTVSTPDHTHAVASMMAIKYGKHTFTQKPLTHDAYEARALTEAAARYGVCTQMGNQGTSENGLREAVEVVQSGGIGPVREVHVWTNRPVWPQGIDAILKVQAVSSALHGEVKRPSVPSTLQWDLWLGTSPKRPYDPIYMPFNWRGWLDWGTGALGDMACHTANMAFMACNLGYPTSLEAEVSEYNPETFPMWSVVRYEFPERANPRGGTMPPLKWTWYDGGKNKPAWVGKKLKELAHGHDIPGSGSLIIGDKGTLFSPNDYGAQYVLLPEADFGGYKPPTPWIPRANGDHKGEWFRAIRENKPEIAMSNYAYSGALTETVVLGCVALRARKRIDWDGPNMKITNDADANQFLKREYRKGWTL
jgi:predicted dehydrogenase